MKYEKIVSVVFLIMLLFLIATTIKIYSVIIKEQFSKPKIETVVVQEKACPIAIYGKCLQLQQVTAINLSEIAGRPGMYEAQTVYIVGEEKPTELKVEKVVKK